MPRARSPERDLAYQLWLDSGKKKKLKDIAAEVGVSESQVRKWKSQDKWNGNATKHVKSHITKQEARKAAEKAAEDRGVPKREIYDALYRKDR